MKIRSTHDDSVVSGKARVDSDRLEINIDTDKIARALAEAGEAALRDAIQHGPQASESTLRARRRKGVAGTRAFHATGRLANELTIERRADGSFDVVAPPGYLADERILQRFQEQILTAAFERELDGKIDKEIESQNKDVVSVRSGRGYF